MMSKIESNDMGFTGIWSSKTKFDCGALYSNPKFSDDVFFNKLIGVTCLSEEMVDKAIGHFRKNNLVPYVYSINYPEFDILLEKKGFSHYDIQHVLKKELHLPKKQVLSKSHMILLMFGQEFSVRHMTVQPGLNQWLLFWSNHCNL